MSTMPPSAPPSPQVPQSALSSELKEVLAFTADENQKHRDFFENLFQLTARALTVIFVVLAAIVGFFGWKTLSDIQKQAKSATDAAIQESKVQIDKTTAAQIEELKRQVGEKVNAEFRTAAIRGTVSQVAAEQTRTVLMPVINNEVKGQVSSGVRAEQQNMRGVLLDEVHKSVTSLQPTIQTAVSAQVRAAVDPAVQARVESQVAPRLAELASEQQLAELVTSTQADDAKAFDKLYNIAILPQTPARDRDIALNAVRSAMTRNDSTALYQTRQFRKVPSQEGIVAALRDSEPGARQAAIDTLGIGYWKQHLPDLYAILTEDVNLRVRSAAFHYFEIITHSEVTPLSTYAEENWWIQHRQEFVKAPATPK